MALPKKFKIKETLAELRKLQRESIPMISNRVRVLIEFKKFEDEGLSKREVADATGFNHNSVQTWRNLYIKGGIKALMAYTKHEGRPSIITAKEHRQIEAKLKDPKNGLRGYVELQAWAENEFKKPIKYNTLLKYSIRKFGSKIKVARKSHVKKDAQRVEAFKKTSARSARK